MRRDPHAPPGPTDGADLYIETLPSPIVRAAGIAAMVTGITMLFACVRFFMSGAEGRSVLVAEGLLVVMAAVEFAVAWGVTGGRTALVFVGFAAAPVVGLLALFVLFTGAFVGSFGASLAMLDIVLLALALSKVRRMAVARSQMRRLEA
jgi:hypothetical protein